MSNKNNFLELQSEDTVGLKKALLQFSSIESIKEENGKLLVFSKVDIKPNEINKFLADKNIFLTHLVKRKHSLEEQFLELTEKKN